jgi:hypothetical protein
LAVFDLFTQAPEDVGGAFALQGVEVFSLDLSVYVIDNGEADNFFSSLALVHLLDVVPVDDSVVAPTGS